MNTYLGTVAYLQIDSGAYAPLTGGNMSVDCSAKTVAITDINGKGHNATEPYRVTVPSFNVAGGEFTCC